jgi:signal transduction histidine kinase
VTNFYQPRLLAEAAKAETEGQRLWQKAGEAGRTSRGYILITVLLASALFCGGTASKFEKPSIRRAVVALGLAAFVFAAARLLLLPVQL